MQNHRKKLDSAFSPPLAVDTNCRMLAIECAEGETTEAHSFATKRQLESPQQRSGDY